METVFISITDYLLKQSWQIAILFAIVAIICLGLKKKTAHLRYLLWLLIIAKCLVPSVITVSLAILPEKPHPATLTEPVAIPEFTPIPEPVILNEAKNLSPPAALAVRRPSIMAQLAQIPPKTWFSVIWLGGVGLYSLIVLIKAVRFNRRLKGQRKPLTAGMQKEFDELLTTCRVGLGPRGTLSKKPKVYLIDGIGQPFVWGLLRGAIFLPANFGQIGSREHRRGILMHEITHTVRFDAAVNCLQAIAQAVFWFHPLVWLANRNIRAEREKCCDETAIARLSAAPRVYSSAIVDTLIAEYQSTQPIPSLAIAGPIKNIEDRIKTIMKPGKKFYNRPTIIALITILLLAIAAVPTTIAITHRQSEKLEEFLPKVAEKASSEFIKKLPNGVTVELVGISYYSIRDMERYEDYQSVPWWGPNGSLLDVPPDPFRARTSVENAYKFVVRIVGIEDCSCRTFGPENQSDEGIDITKGNPIARTDNLRRFSLAGFKPDETETTIKIRIACADWQIVEGWDVTLSEKDTPENFIFSGPEGIILRAPVQEAEQVVAETTHRYGFDETRLAAFDRDGNLHTSKSSKGGKSKDLTRIIHKFENLKRTDIARMEFQRRPPSYEWVEFKDVALRPNFKSDVQVDGEEAIDVEMLTVIIKAEDEEGNSVESEGNIIVSEPAAVEIINKVLAKYAGLDSYSSEGDIFTDMDMSGVDLDIVPVMSDEKKKKLRESKEFQEALQKRQKFKHTFSVKLARPNLYCIEWSQKVPGTYSSTGAVWSADNDNHALFHGRKKSFNDRHIALASATGVSGGATNTIPSLFFDEPTSFFRKLQGLSQQADEKIDGDGCYVISGRLAHITITCWISKKTMLIRQSRQLLGGRGEMPDFSEETIAESLEAMGQEVTPGAMASTKKMMEAAGAVMSNVKGTITEIHRNIVVDQPIEPKGFIPAEAVKNEIEESLSPEEKSFNNLKALGLATIMYANDHEGQFPDSLKQLRPYLEMKISRWISAGNVEYVGKGKSSADNPQTVMAYDKELLDNYATNVLFFDGHVEFCRRKRLETLGIAPAHETAVAAFRAFITAAVKADSEGLKPMVHPASGALQQISDLKQWHDLENVSIVRASLPPNGTSVVTTGQVTDDRGRAGQLVFTMLNANHLVSPKHKWLVTSIDFIPDTAADQDEEAEMKARGESAEKLKELGMALYMYERDHENNLPDSLEELKPYDVDEELAWARANVDYLGKGKSAATDPATLVIGYDKTLFEKEEGTNVLFNDHHVQFYPPERLDDLGIPPDKIAIESRFILVPQDSQEIKDFFEEQGIELPAEAEEEEDNSITAPADSEEIEEFLEEQESIQTETDAERTLLLDPDQVEKLLKLTQTNPGSKLLTAPKVLVFDGESATLSVMQTEDYISGYAESDWAPEPQPKIKTIDKGVTLEVVPKITDDKNIKLDMDIELTGITGYEKRTYKYKSYKIPQIEVTKIASEVTVPEGKTVLLAGNTIKSVSLGSDDDSDADETTKELLILITPTINPESGQKLDN